MSNKAKRHTHKYYKAKLTYQTVWACALPDCPHYQPHHLTELLMGKATLCWKCMEPTVMDARTMAMDKPLCWECDPNTVTPLDEIDSIESVLKRLS